MVEHAHEDWVGADHAGKTHEETLKNGTHIKVTVRPVSDKVIEKYILVTDSAGSEIHQERKNYERAVWDVNDLMPKAVDEAKRYAGGHRGAPLDNHHQKTPL